MKTTVKKFVASMAIAIPLVVAPTAHAQQVTGLTALACEAVLCLSVSAGRPTECAASMAHYFGIVFKKPWKTIQARANFLKLCPDVTAPQAAAQAQATVPAQLAQAQAQAESESDSESEQEAQANEQTEAEANSAAAAPEAYSAEQSQQSKEQIVSALTALKPLWSEQTAQSVAARLVLEKCAEKNGGVESGKCNAEKEDFDTKRAPAIAIREEISRLENLLTNTR